MIVELPLLSPFQPTEGTSISCLLIWSAVQPIWQKGVPMLVLDVKMLEESSDFYLSDSSSTASSIATVLTNNSIDDQPDANAHLGLVGISPVTGLSPQSLTTLTTALHPLGICHQRQHHPHQQHHRQQQQQQPPPPQLPSQQAASPVHLQCLSSIGSNTAPTTTIPQPPPDLQLHSPQSVASSSSSLSSVGSYNSGMTPSLLSDNVSVAHDPIIMRTASGGGDNCIDTMAADSSTGHLAKNESECNNNTTNCNNNSNNNGSNPATITIPCKDGGGESPAKKKNPVGRRKLILSAREKTLRRLESNERERLRMHSLNQAFQVGNRIERLFYFTFHFACIAVSPALTPHKL